MSFLDSLTGPGGEEALASIPLLIGAFEQGRGRPMGNVLEMLGGLIGQHAQYRQAGKSASAFEKFLQGTIKPGSLAQTEYQQFQPIESQFGPDERLAMLQNILGEAQSEAAKKSALPHYQRYNTAQGPAIFDPATGKVTQLPGGVASTGKEAFQEEVADAYALKNYGKDLKTLIKTNPDAAIEVLNTIGQDKNTLALQRYNAEAQTRQADALARMAQSNANAIDRLAQSNENALNRSETLMSDRLGLTPHGPIETYIMDRYNINPGQLRNLPDDKRKALINEATAFAAKTAADKTTATTSARIDATAAGAVKTWASTPLGKSPYFAVDPSTDSLVNDPSMTIGSAANSGLPTIYKTELNAYTQGLEARDTLKSMIPLAQKVLPKAPSTFKNYYTMKAWLEFQAKRGDPDAAAFLAAQAKLIPYLRNMARTSRPNQAEINKILPQISGASNMAQMTAILTDAEGNITSSLKSMQMKGKSDFSRDSSKLRSKAADVGAGITPPASAPPDWTSDDPGASSGKL